MRSYSDLIKTHQVLSVFPCTPEQFDQLEALIDAAIDECVLGHTGPGSFKDLMYRGITVSIPEDVVTKGLLIRPDGMYPDHKTLNLGFKNWVQSVYVVPGSGWHTVWSEYVYDDSTHVVIKIHFER